MLFKKRIGLIHLKEVNGNQSSPAIQTILQTSRDLIVKLANDLQARFEVAGDELVIDVCGVKAYIECEEDLFIVNEVFNERSYGSYNAGEFVLFDIGLNIGISSLFFSGLPQIKKIYAFEPVKDTYQKALRNFALNGGGGKIRPFNIGLGDRDRADVFMYSDRFKGSVGKFGLSDYKKRTSTALKSVEVDIKEAAAVIGPLIEENPEQRIMIKMDCEGGEYEIVPNLKAAGVLSKIDLIVLEWHNNEFLTKLSDFEDFDCFFYKNSPSTGMLYAFNRNK